LPLDIVGEGGSTQGRIKKVEKALIDVHHSIGGTIGVTSGVKDQIFAHVPGVTKLGEGPDLYTGLIEIPLESTRERAPTIDILKEDSLPLNVRSVIFEMVVE